MSYQVNTIDEDRLFEKFTDNAKKLVVNSYDLARKDSYNPESILDNKHLFAAMLLDRRNLAARLLEKLNVDLDRTAEAVLGERNPQIINQNLSPSSDYKKVIGQAFVEAAELGHVYIGTEHILLALMKFEHLPFIKDLVKSGLNYEFIRSELMSFGTYQPGVFTKPPVMDENEGVEVEGMLGSFGSSMNENAAQGKYLPLLGREEELSRLVNILGRKTKNNPVLIGEAGVGKTAIVEGLAQQIVEGNVSPVLKDMEIIQLDIASIIAGAKIRGDVEERLIGIMREIENSPDKILFIDEIHTIVTASGSSSGSDIANILKPYLTGSDIQIIGATTPEEYRRFFEDDGALSRRFQPIHVEELSVDATLEVLKFLRPKFEGYHRVKISDEALEAAVKLSDRYVADRYLPDKSIDLIDEATAMRRVSFQSTNVSKIPDLKDDLKIINAEKSKALDDGNLELASHLRMEELQIDNDIKQENKEFSRKISRKKVTPEDIRTVVSKWTRIPVSSLSATDLKAIKNIKKLIADDIVGQDDAIDKVTAALQRAKLGLQDQSRPLATFLFLGPTGVGKTETAKVIAKELFGSEDALIQVNMSEFMESHSVSKIIGAPPGYIG